MSTSPKTYINLDLERAFGPATLAPMQETKLGVLQHRARELAYLIHDYCAPGRERSLALTELESALHWCHVALARQPESASLENGT